MQIFQRILLENNSDNTLTVNLEEVSNKKYLKLYGIESLLANKNKDILENSLNFSHQKDDLFFGLNTSVYRSIKDDYDDKYEYILPNVTLDKNLFSNNKIGVMDIQSNLQVRNYDTNKTEKFLVNDLSWDIKEIDFKSGLQGKWLANIKNTNYKNTNISGYKDGETSELFGAIGFLSKLDIFKDRGNGNVHYLTPKLLTRFSPNHMRKSDEGNKLNTLKAFELNRLDELNNFEGGLNATFGFDYLISDKNQKEKVKVSVAQIVNDKENKNMPSVTSLDEKLSDLAGDISVQANENFKFNYNFLIDQNYNDLNYSDLGINFSNDLIKFDINYLKENKHIGNKEYIKTNLNYDYSDKSSISFKTKRNIITDSSEYYDLSYEYFNDCLRAGIVYRREFYNDPELEPENSLMFKITLIPFGNIASPSFSQ